MIRYTRRTARAILVVFCLLGYASLAAAAKDKAFFWEVTGQDNTLYLLGSIHFARADFYPLRDAIEMAFAKSDHLAVEININAIDPAKIQRMLLEIGTYPAPDSIVNHLGASTLAKLQRYLAANELPFEALANQKPGLLMITLATLELTKQGLSATQGVDLYLLQQAAGQKVILEMETLEEQFAILLDPEDPEQMLEQSLDELEDYPALVTLLLESWRLGDSDALEELMINKPLREYPESKQSFDKLFTQRNIKMTNKIEAYLATGRSHFVVVGAGHLVGEQGIVELLRDAGYRVTQR